MNRNSALALAVVCGALLPLQVAFNTVLGQHAGGAIFGALGSFLVGLVAITLIVGSGRAGKAYWAEGFTSPRWAWFSGLAGSLYLLATVIVAPIIGLAVASAAAIAGQLSSALVIDHVGWLGFARRPISKLRVLGAVALMAAVLLMSRGDITTGGSLELAGVMYLGGVCLTFGLGMSSTFGRYVRLPAAATFWNFFVGTVTLVALMLTGVFGAPNLSRIGSVPWWGWLGGFVGIIYITSTVQIAPVIGASLTSAAVLAGQIVASLVMDDLGLFGLAAHPITPLRLLGLLLLAAGVWAVQHRSSGHAAASRAPVELGEDPTGARPPA